MTSPLVTCLCITKNSFDLLDRSIFCFLYQTYSNKELLIVYESDNQIISQIKSKYPAKPSIRYLLVPAQPKQTLGDLRNLSIRNAHGEYVVQWDDDDIYHPDRLTEQYKFCLKENVKGSILSRRCMYNSVRDQMFVSYLVPFEGSIFVRKDIIQKYASLNRGEETRMIFTLLRRGNIKVQHRPELYIYIYHAANVWEWGHWHWMFDKSTHIPNVDNLQNIITTKKYSKLVDYFKTLGTYTTANFPPIPYRMRVRVKR